MELSHGRRYWYVRIKNDRSHIGRLLYCVQKQWKRRDDVLHADVLKDLLQPGSR